MCLQERERQLQAELIKKQYLGGDKQKKKMLKPSEKFKFNFDWEAQDDTSQDANPLYKMTHEASLLFGRGMRAGMDRREQMKVGLTAVSPANSCPARIAGGKLSSQQLLSREEFGAGHHQGCCSALTARSGPRTVRCMRRGSTCFALRACNAARLWPRGWVLSSGI